MAAFVDFNEVPFDFPSNFNYKIVKGAILVKEINDESSAKSWLKSYSNISGTTWTVARTYPASGCKVVFKQEWKCHHNVQQRGERDLRRSSKNLCCPAVLRLTVFRIVKYSKSKAVHDFEFPCKIEVNLEHNHLLNSSTALRYKRMSEDTRKKLIVLFEKGHTPVTARGALKLELYLEDSENYYEKVADNSCLPTLATIQYLFNKTSGKKTMGESDQNLESSDDNDGSSYQESETQENVGIKENHTPLTVEENVELVALFQRITLGAAENPVVFLPAVRNMLKNTRELIYTDIDLASALHTFGEYTNHTEIVDVQENWDNMIDVHLPDTQAETLEGKRKIENGLQTAKRPKALMFHDYFSGT